MTDSLAWICLQISIWAKRKKENLAYGCAEMLPRWLVKRAGVRIATHASVGKFSSTDATDVRIFTALRRWDESNG